MKTWSLAWMIARREFRAFGSGFIILFFCLVLGVAMVAAVGYVSTAIETGLRLEGQRLLGGDLELKLSQRPATPEQRAALETGSQVSHIVEMRAIVRHGQAEEEKQALVEVKAVDDLYPLYDSLRLTPPGIPDFFRHDKGWGAYADPILADRLGIQTGDGFRLGDTQLVLRGLIVREPDRVATVFSLGPRLLISQDALKASGLMRPGALVHHLYRLRFAPRTNIQAWLDGLKQEFPEAGWRIRSPQNAAAGVERFTQRLETFLTLAGLTSLLIGGVGIANAVRAYIRGRMRVIAILKCLGAPPRTILRVYGIQLSIIVVAAIFTGLALGAGIAYMTGDLLARMASQAIPVTIVSDLYLLPLFAASGFGLSVATAFIIWPLAGVRAVKAASLFRFSVAPLVVRPTPGLLFAIGCCLAILVALIFLTLPDYRFAVWFIAGASMAFSCLWAMGHVIIATARYGRGLLEKRQHAYPVLRLALANLARPGAPALDVFLSLGVGLSSLIAVLTIDENLERLITQRMPASAPAYFFLDIRGDQTQSFQSLLENRQGVEAYEGAKVIRGRIATIGDIPAEQAEVTPETRWALRGDRMFTVASQPPPGADIVSGDWWSPDYQGEPLISLDAGIAQGFGLSLGDDLTLNILGRDIQARIANLRRIDWGGLNLNFAVILSPGALKGAPMNHIYAVYVDPDYEEGLRRTIIEQFDNVTPIRVRDALETAIQLMGKISLASKLAASLTILSGVLVLVGAMIAVQAQTQRESAIFKVLGATRRQLWLSYLLEYGFLGAMAATLAALLGTAGGWGIVTRLMGANWEIPLPTILLTVGGCVTLTVVAGGIFLYRIYGHRAFLVLRNE